MDILLESENGNFRKDMVEWCHDTKKDKKDFKRKEVTSNIMRGRISLIHIVWLTYSCVWNVKSIPVILWKKDGKQPKKWIELFGNGGIRMYCSFCRRRIYSLEWRIYNRYYSVSSNSEFIICKLSVVCKLGHICYNIESISWNSESVRVS